MQTRLSNDQSEILRLLSQGFSFGDVAEIMGIEKRLVYSFIYEIRRKLAMVGQEIPDCIKPREVAERRTNAAIRDVIDNGLNCKAAAAKHGACQQTVTQRVRAIRGGRFFVDADEVQRMISSGMRPRDVAEEIGVHINTIYRTMAKLRALDKLPAIERIDHEEVHDLLSKGWTQRDVAHILGCTPANISRIVRQ